MSTAELLQKKIQELSAPQQEVLLRFAETLASPQPRTPDAPVDSPRPVRFRVVTSPITGLPVIETDGPPITSEMVRELLADFP